MNQSSAQSATDEQACEKQALAEAIRELSYQACMIARGYWTTVGVGAGAFVDVYGTPRAYETARTELSSCLGAAPQADGGTIALGALFGYGMMAGTALEAQQAVIQCMGPKGYQARPWRGRK